MGPFVIATLLCAAIVGNTAQLVTTRASSTDRIYGVCSAENRILADSDCRYFISCFDQVGWRMRCPASTVFNEEKQECDYIGNVPRCNNANFDSCNPNPCPASTFCEKDTVSVLKYRCTPVSEQPDMACMSNPCRSGTCQVAVNEPRGYICTNTPSTGNRCNPNPCNGGTCYPQNNADGFVCNCPTGRAGTRCQSYGPTYPPQNLCNSNPCFNGGVCSNPSGNQIACTCPGGFYGNRCEYGSTQPTNPPQNACSSNPCLRGDCIAREGNQYLCNCPFGFYGQQCQYGTTAAGNQCESRPCKQGGACNGNANDYTCQCTRGTFGKSCEYGTPY